MFDLSKLSEAEQEAIRAEIRQTYLDLGGKDIDAAIERDRKVLSEHQRELDYVATLPFDKPYRWRIAPSVGLRAQKDLERQAQRQAELREESMNRVLYMRGNTDPDLPPDDAAVPGEVADVAAFIAEAMKGLESWNQERAEASPSATTA